MQEVGQLANEVNILGVMAVALFILVPVSFLLILFIKSSSEGNQSGGFNQEYYDASYKRCAFALFLCASFWGACNADR